MLSFLLLKRPLVNSQKKFSSFHHEWKNRVASLKSDFLEHLFKWPWNSGVYASTGIAKEPILRSLWYGDSWMLQKILRDGSVRHKSTRAGLQGARLLRVYYTTATLFNRTSI